MSLLAVALVVSVFSQPPLKYQHDTITTIRFMERTQVHSYCKPQVDPSIGGIIVACTNPDLKMITMPNPCAWRWRKAKDPYAQLLCHEVGHTEGWPGDHRNARQFIGTKNEQ